MLFSGCTWCGDDAQSQAIHIVEHHFELLEESIEAYTNYMTLEYDSDNIFALSIYNESLGIAIRRGAHWHRILLTEIV